MTKVRVSKISRYLAGEGSVTLRTAMPASGMPNTSSRNTIHGKSIRPQPSTAGGLRRATAGAAVRTATEELIEPLYLAPAWDYAPAPLGCGHRAWGRAG